MDLPNYKRSLEQPSRTIVCSCPTALGAFYCRVPRFRHGSGGHRFEGVVTMKDHHIEGLSPWKTITLGGGGHRLSDCATRSRSHSAIAMADSATTGTRSAMQAS